MTEIYGLTLKAYFVERWPLTMLCIWTLTFVELIAYELDITPVDYVHLRAYERSKLFNRHTILFHPPKNLPMCETCARLVSRDACMCCKPQLVHTTNGSEVIKNRRTKVRNTISQHVIAPLKVLYVYHTKICSFQTDWSMGRFLKKK